MNAVALMPRLVTSSACLALAVLALIGPASAARDRTAHVVSGVITLTSGHGDLLGQGQTRSFPPDVIELGLSEPRVVDVRANTEEYWSFRLSAPGDARLEEGDYDNAGSVGDPSRPGLDVSGDSRACSGSFGSFTVHDIEYGPYDYLESLHATFEYYCRDAAPALRGELDIAAAPPPGPLEFDLRFDPDDVWRDADDGIVRLSGTVVCSHLARASVSATVTEIADGGYVGGGDGDESLTCSDVPRRWLIRAHSAGLRRDTLRVEVEGEARDEWYSDYTGDQIMVSDSAGAEVDLAAADGIDPLWWLVVALGIAAAVAWALLLGGRLLSRRHDRLMT